MRSSSRTRAPLVTAAVVAALALAGCGTAASTSAPRPPPAASTGTSAAMSVLAADYFTGATEVPAPAGAGSAAYGFNGNAEEVAIVYRTQAGATRAVAFYSGMPALVVTADVQDGSTVVTITGADDEMSRLVGQFK